MSNFKVGDKLEFVGVYSDNTYNLTIGGIYQVISFDSDGDINFTDDVGDHRNRPCSAFKYPSPKAQPVLKAHDYFKWLGDHDNLDLTIGKVYRATNIEGTYVRFINDVGDSCLKGIGDTKTVTIFDTRKHDYTGCPAEIRDVLLAGDEVLCKVWDRDESESRTLWVSSYDNNGGTPYPFKTVSVDDRSTNSYRYAKAIPENVNPEIRVMDGGPAIMLLLAGEWDFDSDGDLYNHETHKYFFHKDFKNFGKVIEPGDAGRFPTEILINN